LVISPDEADRSRGGPQASDGGRREHRKFLEDNFLATASTLAAGVIGFALQAISSHALHPGAYGKAFAVYSLFYLITRPSAAFGRLQAWQTSREASSGGDGAVSGSLLRQQTLWLLGVGALIAVASILAAPLLGGFLHVPARDISAAAAGVPFMLALQPLLGILQGEQRFFSWSVLSVLVNLSRLVLIAVLVYPLGALGFQIGNTLAALVTFVVSALAVWPRLSWTAAGFGWRAVLPLLITGLVSTVTFGVFQGSDVVLVEHYIGRVLAGQYAAVATVASAVFFASGGVASAAFPMIARRHALGRSTKPVMGVAFALWGATGIGSTVVLQLLGRRIMLDFAGARYVAGAHYLGWYALGMAVLAWALVLVNTQQSLNDLSLLWVLVPVTVLRPVLLVVFHATVLTVVVVGDLTIAGFALILSAMYLLSERARMAGSAPAHQPALWQAAGAPAPNT
jgi:O-antigen/teichoic acid export membrane protein